jgi:DNA-binding NarL/FixJ family response regulator
MTPEHPIKVAVVEDDARIRRVLNEVFASARDFLCVGTFPNGSTALAALPALKPEVIVMDINLPDLSGVECVAQLAPQMPGTKILMLTVYQDTDTIFRALAAGAHGYLVKPVMPDKLLEAVREIRLGGVPMSPSIARKIIDSFLHPGAIEPKTPPVSEAGLGPREQQVLELVVNGLSQKEISSELGVAVSTVNTYVQRIYEKLHVRSRRGLIALYKSPGTGKPVG